ncbi:hypothetical protein [Candidatus Sororendozoicomonas aggregata]
MANRNGEEINRTAVVYFGFICSETWMPQQHPFSSLGIVQQ